MKRKLLMVGIALIGLTLSLGSNAWADDHGQGGKNRGDDKAYHRNDKTPPGNHYGWENGKGNPHKDRYDHRPDNLRRDRDDHRPASYRRDYHHRVPVVEKRVYHHYSSAARNDGGIFNVAVSVIDQVFSVAVAVSGPR